MSSSLAISAQHLTKVYRLYDSPSARVKEVFHPMRKKYHHTFCALHDATFDVKKGETLGIIGRNGAGKSTLLKILSGVLTPTSGSYSVAGRISSLLELGTGFNPELPGIENIFFNAMLLGVSQEEIAEKLETIVAFADIGEFINQPVKVYSSGMFARLAFAVAFHIDPDILIVDEALAVGDAAFQKKCFERFAAIRARGCTILFVSHDPFQIKGYCQRALYLRGGQVAAFGESAEVVDQYSFDLERDIARQSSALAAHSTGRASSLRLLIKITKATLLNAADEPQQEFSTGETLKIRFRYKIDGTFSGKLSFVVNLYRHDDLYICGATSLMDGEPVFDAQPEGLVTVTFPHLALLAGRYKWRVAINDESGLGIYSEAMPVCEFQVRDNFQSVGLVHLVRKWEVR